MKNIVIAAGYATRLYPLTENFPKPLLPIGNSTILGRLLDDIDGLSEISEHIIITNHKFVTFFEDWAQKQHYNKKITIIDDGTETNETRLGAVRDLLLVINKCNINDDILLIAADNVLDFSFRDFLEEFKKRKTSMIMFHEQTNIELLRRTGVIAIDENMKVLEMQEKPTKPVSNFAVPPFYIYCKTDLPLIKQCLVNGCGYDAPGNLARYLVELTTMHAWKMLGNRKDIGTLDTYYEMAKTDKVFKQ